MDEKRKRHPIVDFPAGILKGCVDSYISILPRILNTSLERGCFPNQFKLAEVTPVFKKEVIKKIKKIIALCVFFPTHPRYLKE